MSKKIISMVIALTMMATLFTGCLSGNVETDTKNETKTSNEKKSTANRDAKVIKISNGISDKHPVYKAQVEVFKKMVEEETDGRYVVEVYHSNQLGDDVKATEALRAGTLEMTFTSTAPLVGMVKELAIFDIPFLFPDNETADAILDGKIGDKLSSLMPDQGLINLAWAENGFRHLTNSVKAVKTPEDLKGMKIRTMENNLHLAAWKAMGANPTPMSWSEVFVALEQKSIDGQENPVPNFYSARIHEVNPYITTTGHVYSPFMILFSKKIWDKIPQEDQEIIRKAAKETAIYARKWNREAVVDNLEIIKEEGGTVVELTPEQKKPFQEATKSVWDLVAKQVGQDFIDEVRAEIEKLN